MKFTQQEIDAINAQAAVERKEREELELQWKLWYEQNGMVRYPWHESAPVVPTRDELASQFKEVFHTFAVDLGNWIDRLEKGKELPFAQFPDMSNVHDWEYYQRGNWLYVTSLDMVTDAWEVWDMCDRIHDDCVFGALHQSAGSIARAAEDFLKDEDGSSVLSNIEKDLIKLCEAFTDEWEIINNKATMYIASRLRAADDLQRHVAKLKREGVSKRKGKTN